MLVCLGIDPCVGGCALSGAVEICPVIHPSVRQLCLTALPTPSLHRKVCLVPSPCGHLSVSSSSLPAFVSPPLLVPLPPLYPPPRQPRLPPCEGVRGCLLYIPPNTVTQATLGLRTLTRALTILLDSRSSFVQNIWLSHPACVGAPTLVSRARKVRKVRPRRMGG